jgi:hypothetical protein
MSHNANCKALRNRYKCPYCQKGYMMEWACQNHTKVCPFKTIENQEKN